MTESAPRFPLDAAQAAAVVSASTLAGAPAPLSVEKNDRLGLVRYDDAPLGPGAPCCLAIGAFDGVHLGHQALVDACVRDARKRGVAAVAVTFSPDPSEVLGKPQPRLLCCDDRVRGLASRGVSAVAALRFDDLLMATGYRNFVDDVLSAVGVPVSIHVGSDFAFGARGEGTVARLTELGRERGFDVVGHELVSSDGATVTATRVRGLLAAGDVREAAVLLGRCHFVRGRVERGRGEGTSFGFPTANVVSDPGDCLPGEGVYACLVRCGDSAWPAAVNVGAPPTFSAPRGGFLEANLIGFEGDLYGREVEVSFLEFLRPSRAFSSVAKLERVVLGNVAWVRDNVGPGRVEVVA